jgi:hypothetical protein
MIAFQSPIRAILFYTNTATIVFVTALALNRLKQVCIVVYLRFYERLQTKVVMVGYYMTIDGNIPKFQMQL